MRRAFVVINSSILYKKIMLVYPTIVLLAIPVIICDDLSNSFCDKDNKYCINNSKEDRWVEHIFIYLLFVCKHLCNYT